MQNSDCHTVTGRIIDSNGNGISDIAVTLSGASKNYSTTTGSNGIYTINSVHEGLYLVYCSKIGHVFSIPKREIIVDSFTTIQSILAIDLSLVPVPAQDEFRSSEGLYLSWSHKNSLSGEISYDIKFGSNKEALPVVATNLKNKSFGPEIFFSHTHYWQVVIHLDGNTFESSVWRLSVHEPFVDMKSIPAGSFMMGSNDNDNEKPMHLVTLDEFEMSATPITEMAYHIWPDRQLSPFEDFGLNYPQINVEWYEAVKFCNWLSDDTGLERCYNDKDWSCDFSKNGFRLPTEAEWEYACRAGTTTRYYTGDSDDDVCRAGWFLESIFDHTELHKAGQKPPNAWGLFDMHGNVWEWCHDWYGEYSSESVSNPTGPDTGTYRVMRGGSFECLCSSASRVGRSPLPVGNNAFGFRVVRKPFKKSIHKVV